MKKTTFLDFANDVKIYKFEPLHPLINTMHL